MSASHPVVRWGLRALLAVLALGLVAVLGVLVWARTGVMEAEPAPWDAVQDAPRISVTEDATALVLSADGPAAPGIGLVFLPGAKVEPTAYAARLAPLAAEHGITVVIAKPHLGLALLDRRDLDTFTSAATEVDVWMVGGHSLGGVRACQLAEAADALVLFAAYCAGDLSATGLPVLSLAGSEDGLSTPEKIAEARDLLPADAQMVEIDGANHASFGDYGAQDGDGSASIGDAEMTAQVTGAVVQFAAEIPGA